MEGLLRLLTQIFMWLGVLVISLLFTAAAEFLRLLPRLVPMMAQAVWGTLVLSGRLYYLLIGSAAPFVKRYTDIDIRRGIVRLGVTVSLSFVCGIVILVLLGWPLGMLALLLCMLHGVFVSLIWNDIPDHGRVFLGRRLNWDS